MRHDLPHSLKLTIQALKKDFPYWLEKIHRLWYNIKANLIGGKQGYYFYRTEDLKELNEN